METKSNEKKAYKLVDVDVPKGITVSEDSCAVDD